MPAHVGQRFADDLGDHLAVMCGEHVLGAVARQLDTDPIKAREVLGLPSQVAQQTVRADRGGPKIRQRFTHAGERFLQDLEDVGQSLVGPTFALLEVDLEQGDRAGQLGRDAVMQLARDPRPLSSYSVLDRLVRKAIFHRAATRRRAKDWSSAIAIG